jgi:hypothetical protein
MRRYCWNTAPVNGMHTAEGPVNHITEKQLNRIVHHLEISGVENDSSRITMPKSDILRKAEYLHLFSLQRHIFWPAICCLHLRAGRSL